MNTRRSRFSLTLQSVKSKSNSPHGKGKLPWIELDGEVVTDSHFIIQFLERRFNLNTDSHLTRADLATKTAFQRMIEEHFYFAVTHSLYTAEFSKVQATFNGSSFGKKIIGYLIRGQLLKQTRSQGIGRHTREEVKALCDEDLGAVSQLVGEKRFILGTGEQPSTLDAIMFGALSGIEALPFESDMGSLMHEKYPNLVRYVRTLRDVYWPDWPDLLISAGGKKPQ